MGYNTRFKGKLNFNTKPTAAELLKLETFLGKDFRKMPEIKTDLTFINLKFCNNFSQLKWSGKEKSYNMVETINLMLSQMQKDFPDFGLNGSFKAKGEYKKDKWKLIFKNGIATKESTHSKRN